MSISVLTSIDNFLGNVPHNGPDLVRRWHDGMETQVNVTAGNGQPVEGRRNTWTDGEFTWWNIRVPKNANTEPEFNDYNMRYPLDLFAEGIGCTGWDWKARRSRWFGFDFDAITGHAAGHGISKQELTEVLRNAEKLPYVESRKSTGGAGVHLYVYLDDEGFPTANHTEHAALARCILGMMSSEAGFDFAAAIDVCGSNMWIWHRKMTTENEGLKLIKPADAVFATSDIPTNWQEHIDVVSRRRTKVKIAGLNGNESAFDELTLGRRTTPLDDKHKELIKALQRSGFTTVWATDHHLLQTHTKALQNLIEDPEKRKELGLVGLFKTVSQGNNPGSANCFMFPEVNGTWRVIRFGQGVAEHDTWKQDGKGWTYTTFNIMPDLRTASLSVGAVEKQGRGGFLFKNADHAKEVVEMLGGGDFEVPRKFRKQQFSLKKNGGTDNRIVIETKKPDKESTIEGWDDSKATIISKVLNATADTSDNTEATQALDVDDTFRALIGPDNARAGWVLKTNFGWDTLPKDDIRSYLVGTGLTKPDAEGLIGQAVGKPWRLCHGPFQPEYPGDRKWNRNSPQFIYQPSGLDQPHHPHWDMILKHIGGDLDQAVRESEWSDQLNIKTGYQYLLNWIACAFRDPYQPLPYLFLFGPSESGKSIFYEALELLVTTGVVRADRALESTSGFNGELEHAVFCVIEEKDLTKNPKHTYAVIKDMVTSKKIAIRKMRTDLYMAPNFCKFIHCANNRDAIPVFPGDTRITMCFVPALPRLANGKTSEIPKEQLCKLLMDEAPDFMQTLMSMPLPAPISRLRVPCVGTTHKRELEQTSMNLVEQYIDEKMFLVPGESVKLVDFYDGFREWCPEDKRQKYNRQMVTSMLPIDVVYGTRRSNIRHVGNVSFEDVGQTKPRLINVNGILKHEEN